MVFLDIFLDGANGYQVARGLKKTQATKNIKIIMVTAKVGERERFWGMESGADEYVTKPFEMPVLITLVKKLLG